MKLVVVACFFSLCVVLPLISADPAKVEYCSQTSYEVKVNGVDITPLPVQRGKNATFSVTAATDKNLSGGKLVVDAMYYGYDFYTQTFDLCEKTSCPISAGNFVISHSQELPLTTVSGDYTLQMSLVDEEQHELTCITINFSIGVGIDGLVAKSMRVLHNFFM